MDYGDGMIRFIDVTGTFVFALSGALAAREKQYDIFGALVLAFVTALGGGTIRDVLMGSTPVGWMNNTLYLYLIMGAVVTSMLFARYISKLRRTFFLFDTIGIGLFTILGLEKALGLGLDPVVAVLMGTVSAVFGGVLRDVLSNEKPLIFRQEVYATACISGGILYLVLKGLLDRDLAMVVTISFIIVIRILAVRFNWQLPLPGATKKRND